MEPPPGWRRPGYSTPVRSTDGSATSVGSTTSTRCWPTRTETLAASELDAGNGPLLRGLPTLDQRALVVYRRRLAAIADEIESADHVGDQDRSAALEDERAQVLAEVRRATGLGGRVRTTSDAAERARVNVTRNIRPRTRADPARRSRRRLAPRRFPVRTGNPLSLRPHSGRPGDLALAPTGALTSGRTSRSVARNASRHVPHHLPRLPGGSDEHHHPDPKPSARTRTRHAVRDGRHDVARCTDDPASAVRSSAPVETADPRARRERDASPAVVDDFTTGALSVTRPHPRIGGRHPEGHHARRAEGHSIRVETQSVADAGVRWRSRPTGRRHSSFPRATRASPRSGSSTG